MKASGPGFKTLYDTGMGRGSGMSEGLGSDLNEKPSGEAFQVELEIPQESKVACEFENLGFCNFKKSYLSLAYSDLAIKLCAT